MEDWIPVLRKSLLDGCWPLSSHSTAVKGSEEREPSPDTESANALLSDFQAPESKLYIYIICISSSLKYLATAFLTVKQSLF